MFLNNNWCLLKFLKNIVSLYLTSFPKRPMEYYFFRTLCPTGFEKLFAALQYLPANSLMIKGNPIIFPENKQIPQRNTTVS